MAEIPRLHSGSGSGSGSLGGSGEINGLKENMGAQKISVFDHMINGFSGNSDSFIVDLESFSNGGGLDNDISTNSRITLQRSFSRKGSHRGAGDRDSPLLASSSSPRAFAAGQTGPRSTPEKPAAASSQAPVVVTIGPSDHSSNQQQNQPHRHHHQITMKTGNVIAATTALESRGGRRYNSFKRAPPPSWFSDPKRVLLFFATLSSIGTMLLICFTLAMSKPYESDSSSDWQP